MKMKSCGNCGGDAWTSYNPGIGTSDAGYYEGGCRKCGILIKAECGLSPGDSYLAAKSVTDIWNSYQFTIPAPPTS